MTPLSVSGPVKAIAFLVFVAGLAGATWGVQTLVGEDVTLAAFSATPARSSLNATEGHAVTFPVTLANRGTEDAFLSARITGPFEGVSGAVSVPAGAERTVFVKVNVPEGATPGTYHMDLGVLTDAGDLARHSPGALTLRVLQPAGAMGFGSGDVAQVLYTGRLTDNGQVFNTNDPRILPLPIPKSSGYSASAGRLEVREGGVVPGFYEGMVGIQPGESRTFSFPAAKGYGPATLEESQPRTETLDAVFNLDVRKEQVGRQAFIDYISQSGQGDPNSYGVNSTFQFSQGPNVWIYRITNISRDTVDYRLALEPGMNYTLYPHWPGASVVEAVNTTSITFRTTPTQAVGEAFTARTYWPNMTVLESVNDTSIVMRHNPTVGLTYQVPQPNNQPPRSFTVLKLDDDTIYVSTPSQRPLAGKDLTFDVIALEVGKAK